MLMTFAEHEIERSVEAFARSPNGGLVVTQSASATVYRDVVIAAAARYKLPAVYALRFDATGGGLISYGPNIVDQFRQAAACGRPECPDDYAVRLFNRTSRSRQRVLDALTRIAKFSSLHHDRPECAIWPARR
jgi:hypothetical protein